MTASAEVLLHGRVIGSLVEDERSQWLFRFAETYRRMTERPTLGQKFEDDLTIAYRGKKAGCPPTSPISSRSRAANCDLSWRPTSVSRSATISPCSNGSDEISPAPSRSDALREHWAKTPLLRDGPLSLL